MTFEQVQSKLDILKENLQRLDEIPQATFEEFPGDLVELLDLLLAIEEQDEA